MCFVEAALAVERSSGDNGDPQVFLLEEVVGEKEGPFRKYLNNVSTVPVSFVDKENDECAQFLAFVQHVQYFKTRKRAFISDYQGKPFLPDDWANVNSILHFRWRYFAE